MRVAVDDPRPRLLAELPVAEGDASGVLAAGLTALLDRPAEELIVVHGAGPPPAVPPAAAAAVRVVPAAVAALGCHLADTADAAAVPADVVVVDAGRSGTDVVRVSGGRVVTACRVPVGGTVLDDVTAELLGVRGTVDPARARAVREELSLLPLVRGGEHPADLGADAVRCALAPPLAAVVAAVRTVVDGAGPGRSPPVLLIGGVARTPLLAELLDAAGVPDVRVAERPDAAAVVGALRLPAQLLGVATRLELDGPIGDPGRTRPLRDHLFSDRLLRSHRSTPEEPGRRRPRRTGSRPSPRPTPPAAGAGDRRRGGRRPGGAVRDGHRAARGRTGPARRCR